MSGKTVLMIFFGVIGAFMLVYVGLVVLVALSINGQYNMQAGGLKYWLMTPKYMQSFPAEGDCLEARYAYQARDGLSPSNGSIKFGTNVEEKRMRQIKTWFEEKSCSVKETEFSMIAQKCQNTIMGYSEVKLFKERTAQACHLINVEFFD